MNRMIIVAAFIIMVLVTGSLQAGWEIQQPRVTLVDTEGAKAVTEPGPALSAAAGHLDSDGVVDLVTGHALGEAGALVVLLGNPEYRLGARHEAWREQQGLPPFEPFSGEAQVFDLPFAPQWLAVGDFDADGDHDVVCASRTHDELLMMAGDGRGGLTISTTLPLPGPVTALVAGEVNRRDLLSDLVVAVDRAGVGELLVFESPEGAMSAAAELFAMPALVSDVAVGRLNNDGWWDIAAAAGEVVIVLGRDRMLSRSKRAQQSVQPPRLEKVALAAPAVELELGRFDPASWRQLAVRRSDEVVDLVHFADGAVEHRKLGSVAGAAVSLVAAQTSGEPGFDLVAAGGARTEVLGFDGARLGARGELEVAATGVIPVRLNRDAQDDLVLLGDGVLPRVARSKRAVLITVTSADDSDDGYCTAGHCSLREAIHATNAAGSGVTMLMDLPLGATIAVGSELPPITKVSAVTIDGTVGDGLFTSKLILDGSTCGSTCDGLILAGGGDTLTNMVIGNFGNAGLRIEADWNVVEGCWLGVESASSPPVPNKYGIEIYYGSSNTVGGTTASARNVLSGNTDHGMYVRGDSSGTVCLDNAIEGNYVGLDTVGNTAMGNGSTGLYFYYASDNRVGSALPNGGNVIGSNGISGIRFQASPSSSGPHFVVHNLIGFAADEVTARAHPEYGIRTGTPLTVGGTAGGQTRNVVGNNAYAGVYLSSGSAGSLVSGNYIGVASDGLTAAPNDSGVYIAYNGDHTIGGTVAGARNVISGNSNTGVANSVTPSNIEVLGNFIGVDSTGAVAVGNGGPGIRFQHCTDCSVGEQGNPDAANVISANNSNGVVLNRGSGYVVAGNTIGLGIGGQPRGNGNSGIYATGAENCTVVENTIAKNGENGITVRLGVTSEPASVEIGPNAIHDNFELGIDLQNNGVTDNDVGDADLGPNNLQNFPVITSADPDTGQVTATLDSDRTYYAYDIHFYASPSCDPLGHGEGKTWLGTTTATTNGSGDASISVILPGLQAGDFVAATAADQAYNTSEFSACFEAVATVVPLIFADGFESGSTSAWDVAQP